MNIDLIHVKYLNTGYKEPYAQLKNNSKLIETEVNGNGSYEHVSIDRLIELHTINLKILEYIKISNWNDIKKLNNIGDINE